MAGRDGAAGAFAQDGGAGARASHDPCDAEVGAALIQARSLCPAVAAPVALRTLRFAGRGAPALSPCRA